MREQGCLTQLRVRSPRAPILPYSRSHCTSNAGTGALLCKTGTGSIFLMTDSHATPAASQSDPASPAAPYQLSVLLYSDDIATRDAVRVAVGRRPGRDVEVSMWLECATAAAVIEAVETGEFDLLVLDGEAGQTGGLGLCRQLKNEIFRCPPVLVLTGRPQDGWLAAWSQADLAVPHPLDPFAVAGAVAELGRRVGASATTSS
jgi:CheY-like chemotaxis protein